MRKGKHDPGANRQDLVNQGKQTWRFARNRVTASDGFLPVSEGTFRRWAGKDHHDFITGLRRGGLHATALIATVPFMARTRRRPPQPERRISLAAMVPESLGDQILEVASSRGLSVAALIRTTLTDATGVELRTPRDIRDQAAGLAQQQQTFEPTQEKLIA